MALYLKLTEPSLFGSFATLLPGFSWRMGIISEAVSSQVKCRTSVRCLVPEKKLKGKWEHKDYAVFLLLSFWVAFFFLFGFLGERGTGTLVWFLGKGGKISRCFFISDP